MVNGEGDPVRIHAFDPDALEPSAAARLLALLDAEERERLTRFRPEASRRQFLVAHGLLRLLLAAETGHAPFGLRFRQGAAGKPYLDPEGPRFSLTHTGGLVAVAVAGVELGLDAERLDPRLDPELLVREVLTAAERAWWLALPAERRRAGLYRLWALKEALLKGTGLGLGCPPRELGFAFEPAALVQAPAAVAEPESWRFAEPDLGPGHACALAVRGSARFTLVRLDPGGLLRLLDAGGPGCRG